MSDPHFDVSPTEREAIHWFYRALGLLLAGAGVLLVALDFWLLGQGTLFRIACGLLVPAGGLMVLAGREPRSPGSDGPS
ncbi:MAG: hypothetical protein EA352_02965 [Gemmatimonadales bacterium]|nr:MAG: hypothetical protein EA352_02965 [Gemmatimonadales bacterium]